jgi:hypothetical protein
VELRSPSVLLSVIGALFIFGQFCKRDPSPLCIGLAIVALFIKRGDGLFRAKECFLGMAILERILTTKMRRHTSFLMGVSARSLVVLWMCPPWEGMSPLQVAGTQLNIQIFW